MVLILLPSYVTIGPLNLCSREDNGVEWILQDFKGWGAPGGTLTQTQKTRQRGAWSGRSDSKPRPTVASGTCIAPTAALASDALDRLIDACSLDESLMTVVESGRARTCMVRRDGDVIPVPIGACAFEYSVQFAADDPRKLGAPLTGSTALPSSTGGLVVPVTVPLTINSTVTSGQVSLFNPGNETGPVLAHFVGPLIGPILTHVGSGLRLVFSASATIADGEFWDVDMEAHTVLAQGQANRAGWITSRQWSGFEPGNNTWSLSAVSATTGSVTITATPADQ
jgi:hypothetical protein